VKVGPVIAVETAIIVIVDAISVAAKAVHGEMMETGTIAANMATVAHMSEVFDAAKMCTAKMCTAGPDAAQTTEVLASAKSAQVAAAEPAHMTATESAHMAAATEAAAMAAATTSATCLGRGREQAGSNKSCRHYRYQSFHVSLPFLSQAKRPPHLLSATGHERIAHSDTKEI
jgi:hypothetical protein